MVSKQQQGQHAERSWLWRNLTLPSFLLRVCVQASSCPARPIGDESQFGTGGSRIETACLLQPLYLRTNWAQQNQSRISRISRIVGQADLNQLQLRLMLLLPFLLLLFPLTIVRQ